MRTKIGSYLLVANIIFSVAIAQPDWRYAPSSVEGQVAHIHKQVRDRILMKPISINTKQVPLPFLMSIISQQAGIPIVLREINYPSSANNEYMQVSYFAEGKPLYQVLDEITGMFDLWWKKEGGRIVIYKYEGKTYRLTLPLMKKEINTGTQEVKIVYDRKFIDGIEENLSKLLYDSKSKVSVSQTGFVFVFGRKSEVESIEEAISKINKNFTMSIPLRVRVAIIRDDKGTSTSISFRSLLSRNFPISFTPAGTNGIFSVGVIRGDAEAFFNFLHNTFKAKIVEDAQLFALNGQPIVYEQKEKTRIISRFQLSYVAPGQGQTQNATPTITMQTEDISRSGTSLYIVPYYIDEDRVVVDLFRKGEKLKKLDTESVNLSGFENKIALPTTSEQSNLSQTVIRRGETLVLFTGDMTSKEIAESGIPFLKDIPVLGYLFKSHDSSDNKYRIVMTITFEDESTRGSETENVAMSSDYIPPSPLPTSVGAFLKEEPEE